MLYKVVLGSNSEVYQTLPENVLGEVYVLNRQGKWEIYG